MITIINIKKTKPPNDNYVYIGRGSIYGNPFTHLELASTYASVQLSNRQECINAYTNLEQERRNLIISNILSLQNKTLGCFCKPLSCHGDILAWLVERALYND